MSTSSELWSFDVVQHEEPAHGLTMAARDTSSGCSTSTRSGRYVAIVANALVGHRRAGRVAGAAACGAAGCGSSTIAAEAAMMLQVLVGVVLVASKEYTAPRFHMFYGFLAFLTVGLAYSYRQPDARPPRDVLRPRRPVHHGPRHPRRPAGA